MDTLFNNLDATHQPPPEVTKSAFADELGLSKARVSQLVEQGLPLTADGKRVKRLDALAWYRENIAPHRRKALSDKPHADPRRELDRVKLEAARIDLEKARGALIDRAEAEKAVFERARLERDAHLAWVSRVAPLLAVELDVDPAALFSALDRQMRAHLVEIAETPLDALTDDA